MDPHTADSDAHERVFITHICATGLASRLRRLPAGFYVCVEIDGVITKTLNKPLVVARDAVEWDEVILLPSKSSFSLIFKLYASFELGQTLGVGELLGQLPITGEDVLSGVTQRRSIRTLVHENDQAMASYLSLTAITERRICDVNGFPPRFEAPDSDKMNQLEQFTDAGHYSLLRYRHQGNQKDLDSAIACFERVRILCPSGYHNRSAVLFNLAVAKLFRCQYNDAPTDLDLTIALFREVLQLRTSPDLNQCATALHLSFALLASYWRRGNEKDKMEARDLLQRVVELSPVESYDNRAARFALKIADVSMRPHIVEASSSQTEGTDPDDKPVRAEQAILLGSSDLDSPTPTLLADRGMLLYRRFEESGDREDIHRAVSMLEAAVKLTPDVGSCKPILLGNLAGLLQRRFERFGEVADIGRSIAMQEEAVRLADDLNKRALLSNLVGLLSLRYQQLGESGDMNKIISVQEEAIGLTPDSDPNKLALLYNLGSSLFCRFEWLGELVDLSKSILIQEEAVCLAPDGHPEKPALLNNLSNSLSRRFEHLGELADINKSISFQEKAVCLTANGHPDKAEMLQDLGTSLSQRFQHFGELADINRSILVEEEALGLIADGDPDMPAWSNDLGNSFFRRFEQLGDLLDISNAISLQERAVHLTLTGHPKKPERMNNLGNSLYRRFKFLGELADINKAISLQEEVVQLTPDGHSRRPAFLNNLGNSLLSRFERLGELADVSTSVSIQEDAVRLTPDNHPSKPALLNNLGFSLSRRFDRLGELADMSKCISLQEEAVRLTPSGHPNKPMFLNNLGYSLSCRFKRLGELADIGKSILVLEEAIHLTPDGHPDKPARFASFGVSLLYRFQDLGELTDISKSVSVGEEAVRLTPEGHPDRSARLNNLVLSLLLRFQRLCDFADMRKSISVAEEAIHLSPDDHPNKPFLLNTLGMALINRFECSAELVDINTSISVQDEAVNLAADGHPYKPGWLNDLGSSLRRRFERAGELADIIRSISVQEAAVRLTPDGHPNKPRYLMNLGNDFIQHFARTHDLSSLSAAIFHFSVAARASTGPVSARFEASRHWISSLSLQSDSPDQLLLDAYSTTINLLPELAWLGLPLMERHRVLYDTADITRDAAATALDAASPEKAVEWLEQGRSIVWNQFLQLRTPVDELRIEHPALADAFWQISQQLEHASTHRTMPLPRSEDSWFAEDESLEAEVQRHHELALRRERLLADIRSLNGFERFLLPRTIKQLAVLTHSAKVIYLNANQHRCDALIVSADLESVTSVPLPGINYAQVEELHRLLRFLLERSHLIMSRHDLSVAISPPAEGNQPSQLLLSILLDDTNGVERAVKPKPQQIDKYTPDELFERILAYLWVAIVNPVIKALDLLVPPPDGEKLPRIYWCPTGPFAFLPIHAAGLYDTGPKLSDFAISSYIPTLNALAISRKDPNTSSPNICLVTVPQPPTDGLNPLALVGKELSEIGALSSSSPFVTLQNSDGTFEDVTEKMKCSDWVHFACHAIQDPENPLDSGLCLADCRRLKLSDIIRLSRPQAGLAFLSACQTAQGDEKLPEESVHLAAGMLLAGYSSVIATMWAIRDADAPKVTRAVYAHLFRDGKVPDSAEAAEALHYAVQRLRESGAPPTSWVPFIHVGR